MPFFCQYSMRCLVTFNLFASAEQPPAFSMIVFDCSIVYPAIIFPFIINFWRLYYSHALILPPPSHVPFCTDSLACGVAHSRNSSLFLKRKIRPLTLATLPTNPTKKTKHTNTCQKPTQDTRLDKSITPMSQALTSH